MTDPTPSSEPQLSATGAALAGAQSWDLLASLVRDSGITPALWSTLCRNAPRSDSGAPSRTAFFDFLRAHCLPDIESCVRSRRFLSVGAPADWLCVEIEAIGGFRHPDESRENNSRLAVSALETAALEWDGEAIGRLAKAEAGWWVGLSERERLAQRWLEGTLRFSDDTDLLVAHRALRALASAQLLPPEALRRMTESFFGLPSCEWPLRAAPGVSQGGRAALALFVESGASLMEQPQWPNWRKAVISRAQTGGPASVAWERARSLICALEEKKELGLAAPASAFAAPKPPARL